MAMTFSKPSLMEWDGHKITDHNRSDLGVDVDRIEESTRMANGTLRKYVVADKRSYSVSWKDLPHNAMFTVDGYWGKREMENLYNTTPGAVTLKIYYGDGTSDIRTVVFTKFSASISKRGRYDFWDVNVTMEEV